MAVLLTPAAPAAVAAAATVGFGIQFYVYLPLCVLAGATGPLAFD